jgi:hypothetical protein
MTRDESAAKRALLKEFSAEPDRWPTALGALSHKLEAVAENIADWNGIDNHVAYRGDVG